MSNARNESKVISTDLSGCEAMEKLWQSAKECNLTEPGIAGTPGRVSSFVTCKNIEPFMRLSAIKCWEERTKFGTNPYALFTPLDISAGSDKQAKQKASSKNETSFDNNSSQSNTYNR